jgi:hypothetical protein
VVIERTTPSEDCVAPVNEKTLPPANQAAALIGLVGEAEVRAGLV